ncbi:MAG TPA: HipA domain-containing protein [Chthoniobacterales bacterium]|jgi:serine/threonine-protein kinase HipA|nr:HipA domain-containing protein [Chthoniobacterales bacterium]
MTRCPITYEELPTGRSYSIKGLRQLDRRLTNLLDLPFSAEEQRHEALRRAGKMSIQGLQLKLSAVLNVEAGRFDFVDRGGRFLLKPPSTDYAELPENEDVTMRLAAEAGIEIPFHGMVRSKDGSLTYFIKRFDRTGRKDRVPVEDFAQLTGNSRDTKYDSSMEKVSKVLDFCTFPALERARLFRRTIFSFLVGNEDMHLKNFSLISRDEKQELSPAYDLVNSTLALAGGAKEELALPIHGKRSRLTRKDLLEYFPSYLKLPDKLVADIMNDFKNCLPGWKKLIGISFLKEDSKEKYARLLEERAARLQLS